MSGRGSKRSFNEVDASSPELASDDGGHRGKRPMIKKEKKSKEDNLNWVKKRARDIERRLKRDDSKLPANVQADLERELAAHRTRIAEEQERKRRSKMIGKYHMVRFFERKKAMRLAEKLRKKLKNTTEADESERLKADLHIAEVDINYAMYFPFLEPYVSLYKGKDAESSPGQSAAQLALHSPRPALWSTIEKAMEEGQEALERLRDRHPGSDSKAAPEPASAQIPAVKVRDSKAKQGRRGALAKPKGSDMRRSIPNTTRKGQDESSDSEGGFFEED